MKRILFSALIPLAVSTDPCDQFCRFFDSVDLCGDFTSECDGQICTNLYWTVSESGRRSAYFGDLPVQGAVPVTCDDATTLVSKGEYPPVEPNMSPLITMLQILTHLKPVQDLDWISENNMVLLSIAQMLFAETPEQTKEIAQFIENEVDWKSRTRRRDVAAFATLVEYLPPGIFATQTHDSIECLFCGTRNEEIEQVPWSAPFVVESVTLDLSNLDEYRSQLTTDAFCLKCLVPARHIAASRPTRTSPIFTISIPRVNLRLVHPVRFSLLVSVQGRQYRLVAISHNHGDGYYTAEILSGAYWYKTTQDGIMQMSNDTPATVSRTVSMLFYERV